jgi:hypothetical protein
MRGDNLTLARNQICKRVGLSSAVSCIPELRFE